MIAGDDEIGFADERAGEYVVIVGITAGRRRQGLRFDNFSEASVVLYEFGGGQRGGGLI
ncbi:MAG: hypothetical protein WBF21_11010 [Steroidobacteraceae bacterium]